MFFVQVFINKLCTVAMWKPFRNFEATLVAKSSKFAVLLKDCFNETCKECRSAKSYPKSNPFDLKALCCSFIRQKRRERPKFKKSKAF